MWPAAVTIAAIERGTLRADLHLRKQWLAYWLFTGFMVTAESLTCGILLKVMPHYYSVKLALVVWMVDQDGAAQLWDKLAARFGM